MFDLFAGLPTAVKLLVALVAVLGLFGIFALLLRRFGGSRLGSATPRGRQPRLAVVDGAPVDAKRRLILVRRDNVEHLLMIGGPTDVVVEQNIVRGAVAAGRDTSRVGNNGGDTAQRAAAEAWPPPEPEIPARTPRLPVLEEGPVRAAADPHGEPSPPSVPSPRGFHADALRRVPMRESDPGLARPAPAPPVHAPATPEPARGDVAHAEPPRVDAPRMEPRVDPVARPDFARPAASPLRTAALRVEPPREPVRAEPRVEEPRVGEPRVAAPQASATEAVEPPAAISPAEDQNLAEMAQRLEAALRRPTNVETRPAERTGLTALGSRPTPAAPDAPAAVRGARVVQPLPIPPAAPAPATGTAAPPPTPGTAPAADSKTPRPDTKPAGKTLYDSLEQEMASLFGRPAGKS